MHTRTWMIALCSLAAATVFTAACGDDEETTTTTTTGSGAGTTSTTTTSSGMGGDMTTTTSSGMGGDGMGGDGAGGDMGVHGCTQAAAMDMTGNATVTITDIQAWAVPHNVCVRVSAGTTVVWNGNFTAHPLAGGVSPNVDANSDIPATPSGNGPAQGTMDNVGAFPFFCTIHTTSMTGVIYVE